ncbi:mitochondrial assembly of ribosomal large subunit protein 1 [Trichonephila clavipes]|nr:mitochondrial assembly of ribosomal large subunit protein 1 [Trichonephila clavipes]
MTRSDANSHKQSTNEPNLNLEDDPDFQNILKDFAQDFNVTGESEQILEEFKKSLHEPKAGVPSPDGKSSSSSNTVIDKYTEFSELDSTVIPSHEDLQSGAYENDIIYHIDQNWNRDVSQMQYKRGVSGVYEIHELVELLRRENIVNISVIYIPKELHYTDFLVLGTAKSPRHSKAVVENVLKVYKMKKDKKDPFIVIDGEKTANWKALDMGNIVLHIFLEETRAFYDIESLWLFDSDFDKGGTLKPDPILNSLEEQMAFFDSLQQQASVKTKTSKDTT